jgi:phenylacetic acid degradation operon negative regulatory protein
VTTTRKPLTARSVLASVLLGSEPPWLPTALLVRTGELFGLAEGTVRTALSRMVAAGELEVVDGGHRLTGRLLARQARQSASRRAEVVDWDGSWELAVVGAAGARPAGDRAALRAALTTLRLAELREGAWVRPANLDPARSPDATRVASAQVTWWRAARPDPAPDPTGLWDLAGWAADADVLLGEMAELLGPLEDGDTGTLAEGFVLSAAVLRHLQADPLLPADLLPRGWPGADLRSTYDRFDDAYRAVLTTWFADAR